MTALRDTRMGREARPKSWYLEAGKEYVRRYGESELTQAAFNPSAAKRNGRPDLVERYYAGREDGTIWPSLNSIKKNFDGSFKQFRKELDLKPNKVGGTKRRKPGEAVPILDVRERRVVTQNVAGTTWLERQLEKERRRANRLARELDAEKAKSIEENPRVIELRNRLSETTHRYKDVKRELHNSVRRETRARANGERSDRRGNAATLREVDRLTQKLVEAQDKIRNLSTSFPYKGIPKTKTVTRTVKIQDDKLLRQVENLEKQVFELRSALSRSEALRSEALERLATFRQDAMKEALVSEKVRSAERRVAVLEKQLVVQTEVLVGERRVLTEAEVEKLRNDGPAGEKIFVAMLKRIGRAEGTIARKAAIYDAIAAGYNWLEKL